MRFLILILIMFVISSFGFGLVFDEKNYFSVGVGLLPSNSNLFLDRDIVVFEISDGVLFFEKFSGNVQFILTFPDEWYSLLDFRVFGRYNFFDIDLFINSKFLFDYGFEFMSHFLKRNDGIYFTFRWYGFFIPYFRVSSVFSFDFFEKLYFSFGWYGGMPIVFLPNTEPSWGLSIGYYFWGFGVKDFIVDEISFYSDSSFYIVSFSKRF
ncbi:MAG: hypothetical protein ACPL4C_02210 [Brevinematia bacterium]